MNGGKLWQSAVYNSRHFFRPGHDPVAGFGKLENPHHDYDVVVGYGILIDGRHWKVLGVDDQPAMIEPEMRTRERERSDRR